MFKKWMLEPVINEVKEKCQPFLKQTSLPLYRGTSIPLSSSLTQPFFIQQVRKDRKPRESSALVHQLVDDWFYSKYSIRPRSQAAFCTNSIFEAQNYGKPCYAFPIGEFSYVFGVWDVDEVNSVVKKSEVKKGSTISDTILITSAIRDVMRLSKKEDGEFVTNRFMSMIKWHVGTDLNVAMKAISTEIAVLCDELLLVPVNKINDYNEFYGAVTS